MNFLGGGGGESRGGLLHAGRKYGKICGGPGGVYKCIQL